MGRYIRNQNTAQTKNKTGHYMQSAATDQADPSDLKCLITNTYKI